MTLIRHFLSIGMEGYLVSLPWILRRTTFTFLSFYHWWSHKMKKDMQSNRLVPVFVTVLLLWRDIMTLSILWKKHLTGVLLIVLEVESIIIMVDSMRAGTGAVPEIQSWSVGRERQTLGLTWAVATSKPTYSDILPSTRPYLPILSIL